MPQLSPASGTMLLLLTFIMIMFMYINIYVLKHPINTSKLKNNTMKYSIIIK